MKASILFRRGWIAYIFIAWLLFLPGLKAQSPWPAGAGTDIGAGIAPLVPDFEASGITYHPGLNQILVVSDEGHACKMGSDGSAVSCFDLGALDLEGITLTAPDSPFAYLAVEFPYRILELDLTNESLSGNFWDVPGLSSPPNAGIEALAFIPNGFHPYADSDSGGLFYVGLQDTGEIYVYDVNLAQTGQITLVDQFSPNPGRNDIADLFFLEETETLFAIYDGPNILSEMQADGTLLLEYSAAATDQEGILLIANCTENLGILYIAEDSGPAAGPHILRFEGYPLSCPPPQEGEEGGNGGEETGTEDDSGDSGEEEPEAPAQQEKETEAHPDPGSGGCSLMRRDDKAGL